MIKLINDNVILKRKLKTTQQRQELLFLIKKKMKIMQ